MFVEGEIDLSQWPEKLTLRSLRGFLPEGKAEVELNEKDLIAAARMIKQLYVQKDEQMDEIKSANTRKARV